MICYFYLLILFEAIVTGIVFLVSLYDSSLLVYRNATDFWIFIWYLATLLNSFLVESSGVSMYNIMSSENNDRFTYFFPIWMPFIPSCLIAVSRTSSTLLNKSGEWKFPSCFQS